MTNECYRFLTNECFIVFMIIQTVIIIWEVCAIDRRLSDISHMLKQINDKLK